MPSWISPSDACSSRFAVTLIVGSILAMTATGGTALSVSSALALSSTETWWTAAGGHEDDVTANLDLGLAPVPGGSFLQLSGGIVRQSGVSWPLNLSAQGSWQRFLESGQRSLAAAAVGAEAQFPLSGRWNLRPVASGFFLEDSARPEARLFGAGANLALVRRGAHLDLELTGGGENRHYPRLFILDVDSVAHAHQERRFLVGPGFLWHPSPALEATGKITAAWADASEDWYDAREVTVLGALRWRWNARARLLAHGYSRQRQFPDRPAHQDNDLTLQIGLATEWDLARSTTATFGWVGTRYRDPMEQQQDLQRVSLALTCRFGGRPVTPIWPQPRQADHPLILRLRAPAARVVAVVGDFNGWDPQIHRLTPQKDGWWSIALTLPAGHYQYAYWVDDELVPPGDDVPTVPDGFGGRNGLLIVRP